MRKLGIFTQVRDSGSSWYRAIFPFYHLLKGLDFTYEVIGGDNLKITRDKLHEFDVAFITRPHDPMHFELVKAMRDMNRPVWIDYDDDLFSVPFDHSEYDYFQKDTTRKAIEGSCELANKISVTTDTLKEALISRGVNREKIFVIPNAINDYLYPTSTPASESRAQTIVWRGGITHDEDLKTIGKDVEELTKKGFRFIFMGHKPHAIKEHLLGGQFTRLPEQDIFSYFKSLKQINAPFHFVPLKDTPLNRAKSNIAFLEASWIGGSLVFVPDWVEQPEVIPYKEGKLTDTFINIIELGKRAQLVNEAQDYISNNFLLSSVNCARENILDTLMI